MQTETVWIEPVRRLPDGSVIEEAEFFRRRRVRPGGPPIIFFEDRPARPDEYEQGEGFRVLKPGTWIEISEELPESAPEGAWCRIQDWFSREYCFIGGRWIEDINISEYDQADDE